MTTIHVCYKQEEWETEPTPDYWRVWSDDLAKQFPERIYAGAIEADIPPPPSRAAIVKGRVAKLRKDQAELVHRADLIEEEIGKLLAIEDRSAE